MRFPSTWISSCRSQPNKCSSTLRCFTLIALAANVVAELPKDLDGFLGVLFGTEECEDFLSDGQFLSVATVDCQPYKCDFPHQLCMRPATMFDNAQANQCRDLPVRCLTAANGGVAIPRSAVAVVTSPASSHGLSAAAAAAVGGGAAVELPITATFTPPLLRGGGSGDEGGDLESEFFGGESESGGAGVVEPVDPHRSRGGRKHFGPICEQGVPDGRFCGFVLKFAYNRETAQCDQFWYPGCPTADTNDNLFDSADACRRATDHCGSNGRVLTQRPPSTFGGSNGGNGLSGGGNGNLAPSLSRSGGGINGGAGNSGFNGGGLGGLAGSFFGSALGGGGNAGNGEFGGLTPDGGPRNGNRGRGGAHGGRAGGAAVHSRFRPEPGENFGPNGGGYGNGEYGGGELGASSGGATQPPNFIRLIANTIREVSQSRKGGGGGGAKIPHHGGGGNAAAIGEMLSRFDPTQLSSIFQSFG